MFTFPFTPSASSSLPSLSPTFGVTHFHPCLVGGGIESEGEEKASTLQQQRCGISSDPSNLLKWREAGDLEFSEGFLSHFRWALALELGSLSSQSQNVSTEFSGSGFLSGQFKDRMAQSTQGEL